MTNDALLEACGDGDEEMVKKLLMQRRDVNVEDESGLRPLHKATSPEIAALLLKHAQIQVNAQDNVLRTPFFCACEQNEETALFLLDDERVDVNLCDAWKATPLMAALRNDHVRLVSAVLQHPRVDHVTCTNAFGLTALHLARSRASSELLLRDGRIEPNAVQNDGITALHFCVRDGDADRVEALLADRRTKINIRGHLGFTPPDLLHVDLLRIPVDAKERISKAFRAFARRRFVDVCIGLKGLDMPLLQMLLIVEMDAVQHGLTDLMPVLHIKWAWGKLIRLAS